MTNKISYYPVTIKEVYLDSFGHMNNSVYLTLFEEARWELITQNGFGLKKVLEVGLAPVILEIKLNFVKELRVREEIIIHTELLSYKRKIGQLLQKMIRHDQVCATSEVTLGLFDLKERRLVSPTPEWLKAIGVENCEKRNDKINGN